MRYVKTQKNIISELEWLGMQKAARLFVIFALLSLATRWLCLAVDILDIDEAAHVVGSWELLRGKLLYTDFVNNKPPLLYVYYSLAQLIFGRGMFAVHLFTVLFTVPLTALALASFFRYNRTGTVAGLVFLVYSASFFAHDMLSANTELLMIFPAAWAVTRFREEKDLQIPGKIAASGFLIGIALLFKYPVILWVAPVSIAIVYYNIRTHGFFRATVLFAIFLGSFAIPPALTYAYFAWRGGEQELIYWLFLNNLGYSANPITLQEAEGRALSYFLPFLIATSPLWWLSIRRQRTQPVSIRVLLVGLLLFTLPAAFWGLRFYPHYFIPFYVPLALCAAPWVDQLWSQKKRPIFIYSLFLFAGFTIANCVLYFGDTNVYQERNPAFRNVAQRLKADPCYSGATLFVWGYAPIAYYYAELPVASRFVVLPQSGLTGYISGNLESVRGKVDTHHLIKEKHWDLLMSDLEKNHVTYILDFAPSGIYRWNRYPISDFPSLDRYVRDHFEKLDTVDNVVLYKRKRCGT